MEQEKPIHSLQVGQEVAGFYILKSAFPKTTSSGKPFLNAVLSDRTGAGFGVSIKRFEITAEFRYVLGFSDIFKNPNKNPNSSFYESPIDQMNVTIGLFYRINKPKN